MMVTKKKFQQIQKALNEHDRKLFPGNNVILMTLGVIEEIGELLEAFSNDDEEEMKDSLADIMVFAIQVASFEEIDWWENALGKPFDITNEQILVDFGIAAGRLCHHILKKAQGLGKTEDHHEQIKKALCSLDICVRRFSDKYFDYKFDYKQNLINIVENDILKRSRKKREQRYLESKGK